MIGGFAIASVEFNTGCVKQTEAWPGLRSVAIVESTRRIGVEESTERRYYISSLDGADAARIAAAIRGHWGIENQVHWTLDMAFREDECRVRSGHAAEKTSRGCAASPLIC